MARRGKMDLRTRACVRDQAARDPGVRIASIVVWRPREQDPEDLVQRAVN